MAIYKNVAGQKLAVYAYTAATGASKTGDAAQITAYLSKDWAAAAAIADTNPAELDATNMKGWYVFDLAQAETNAEVMIVAPISSTPGVVLDQVQVFTQDAAISSRASQTSVDDLPTNAELASALATADDAVLTAIADVPTVAEFEARTLPAADYTVVSDLPVAPDNASIAAILVDTGTTLDALIKDVPTKAELDSAVAPLATAAALDIVDNLIDTEIGAIKATTDQLATALELDGAVYRLTANALELAPSGGGAAAPTAAEIANEVWDEDKAGHLAINSFGALLAAAGAAADPLLNEVPGDYPPNSAGAALGNIAGATVAIVSPVSADGTEIGPLVYGDDYAAADNRALVFTTLPGPTLTGGAIALRIQARNGAVSITGTVTGAHAGYVELTAAQIISIGIGVFKYDLEATLATSAHTVTLVTGRATIVKDVR